MLTYVVSSANPNNYNETYVKSLPKEWEEKYFNRRTFWAGKLSIFEETENHNFMKIQILLYSS